MADKITSPADLLAKAKQAQDALDLRGGAKDIQVTVHMGTCGIASGAREVLNALMRVIEETGVSDVNVTTSGCMGLCSREPLVTVELLGKEAIKYEKMDEMKMRQVFKRHVLEGEIQTPFVLAKGAEIVR